MKRTSLAVIALVLLLGFLASGCAEKEPMKPMEETKPPEAAAQPAPEPSMQMPEQPKEQAKAGAPAMANLGDEMKALVDMDIHFDYDRFSLTPEDITILEDKVTFLNSHPDIHVRIEGNCDERGTTEYNLALGDRRAMAIKDYLVDAGIAEGRISTISFGKELPLDPGHNEEAWARNRRGHFSVLSK
jgi:peptidoglycan-associated lipoprotein